MRQIGMDSQGMIGPTLKIQFGGQGWLQVSGRRSMWADMVVCFHLVIVGEISNFAAYTFAPAILVTPLGALSVRVFCWFKDCTLRLTSCIRCLLGMKRLRSRVVRHGD